MGKYVEFRTCGEFKKGYLYKCGSKDFTGTSWDNAFMKLVSYNATYSRLFLKIEMAQYGKDENGFYENYVRIVTDENCDYNVDEMLTDLGYGFKKEEITILEISDDYEHEHDETIVV